MGALPRVRIQEAEAKLADAQDEVILAHDLYGDLPEKGANRRGLGGNDRRRAAPRGSPTGAAGGSPENGRRRRGGAILSGAIRSGVDRASNQSWIWLTCAPI